MATATTQQTVYDASEIDGLITSGEPARSTMDLWGEPIQISAVRIVHQEARGTEGEKDYREARDAVIGSCLSLATNEEFEAWIPDKFRGVLTSHFGAHPDTVIQGRFFKDPQVSGKIKRGWQFMGLDNLPEDKVNRNQAEDPAELPF